jgi:hypothetical protein
MEFLNPSLLWGMLAVTFPVLIHFWYQKKGKTIAWAASRWLAEKTALKHHGIRLDEIPLLLIRCLLVVLLTFLLSDPVVKWLNKDESREKIHLVQSNARVTSNFRFELETALKSEEKVFFLGDEGQEVKNLSEASEKTDDILHLQQAVNRLGKQNAELHFYLVNDQQINRLPKIYVPGPYQIHLVLDSASKPQNPFAGLKEKAGNDNLNVLIAYKSSDEMRTVMAGLSALTDVYAVGFSIDKQRVVNKHYDLILTDQRLTARDPGTLYVLSAGNNEINAFPNIVLVPDSLRLATSDIVRNGQLPEWLGGLLIDHFDLAVNKHPLSQRQFYANFELVKPDRSKDSGPLRQWIMLSFIVLLMLERWIALRTNNRASHA